MMDSTNITENPNDNLDEYGVWVKKAPNSSENDAAGADADSGNAKSEESDEVSDIKDVGNDFDSLPDIEDISLSDNSSSDSAGEGGTEEVSLDDFLGDEALDDSVSAEDTKSVEPADFSADEEVSLDEFLDTDDKEDAASEEPSAIEDEAPLDIDLDFSDENPVDSSVAEEADSSIIADTNVASEFESASEGKTVDLDNFDDIFSSLSDDGSNAAPESSSGADASPTDEQEVDLSEFTSDESVSESPSVESSTESVDLSDFGFSNDSSDENDMKVVDESKSEQSSEIKMNVIADDDIPESNSSSISDIPDTFEEETAIFSEPDTASESEAESPKPSANVSNDVLSQLVSELAALRSEISSLKNDVEVLKKAPAPITESSPVSDEVEEKSDEFEDEDIEIPVASPSDSEGGFFGADDDDDVIALSGDELDDILNNQNIMLDSEEPLEASESSVEPEEKEPEETVFEGPSYEEPATEEAISEPEFDEPKVENLAEDSAFEVPPEITDSEPNFEENVDDIEIPSASADSEGGFFGADDDDDVIALSGDELDDILNTADFTEESDMTASETIDNVTDSLVEEASNEDLIGEVEKPASDSAENDYDALFAEDAPEEVLETSDEAGIPSSNISEEDAFAILDGEPSEVAAKDSGNGITGDLREEIKSVLSYMDQLLESLPEEKITEFAQSEQFETYKKLFKELGLA